jgi:uncharacterized repeat protein (TIGR01451 family)
VVEPDQARLDKVVDQAQAQPGDTAHYTLTLTNDAPLTTTFLVRDPVPQNASYLPGTVTGGLLYDELANELTGAIELDSARMSIVTDTLLSYRTVSDYVDKKPCPDGDCDDAAVLLSELDFNFYGQHFTDLVMSTNGYLQLSSKITDLSSLNQDLPDPAAPNNLIAPLWADLDLDSCTSGSDKMGWYWGYFEYDSRSYYIFEWKEAALKSNPDTCFSFQVWIEQDTSEIWFAYGPQTGALNTATVGVENRYGSAGESYYFNGSGIAPVEGASLKVVTQVDQALFTYALLVSPELGVDIRNVATATNSHTGRVFQASAIVWTGERVYLPITVR